MATFTWINNNGGFWNTSSNWSGGVPGSNTAGDDVVINIALRNFTTTHNTGTTNIRSLLTKETFIYSGGSLTANTITIDGDLVTGGDGTDTNRDGLNDQISMLVPVMAFSNNGTINAINGANLVIGELGGSNFTNNSTGVINITKSRLTFGGNWDNNGTINLNNDAQLELVGVYDNSSFGTIRRLGTNTKIYIQGRFNNSLLTLNSTTGNYILREGGTIRGGSIQQSGANLIFDPFIVDSGELLIHNLENVSLQGDLNLNQVTGSSVLLKGTSNFTGNANLGDSSILAFEDTINGQVLLYNTVNLNGTFADLTVTGGTALVILGQVNLNNSGAEIRSDIQTSTGSRDTGIGIVVNAGGTITANRVAGDEFREIDPDEFYNQGTINAINGVNLRIGDTNRTWLNDFDGTINVNNSVVRFQGNYDNNGLVTLAGTAQLLLESTFNPSDIGNVTRTGTGTRIRILGTLERDGSTDSTLDLNSTTGNYILDGGVIKDLTVNQSGGNLEFSNHSNNSLFGLTVVNNNLNLSNTGSLVTLNNGARFTGAANLSGASSKLILADSTTAPNISFDNVTFNLTGANSLLGLANNDSLILGANTQVNLNATGARLTSDLGTEIGGGTGDGFITNRGVITGIATSSINPDVFTNEGTVRAQNGGVVTVGGSSYDGSAANISNYSSANQTLTGGTWEVLANSTLRLNNANIVNNAATITLDGANSNLLRDNTNNALASFATNMASGRFTIRNSRNLNTTANFSNTGILTIGNTSTFTVGGGTYTQTAGSLSGTGTLAATNVNLNGGTFNPAGSATVGSFSINGNYSQTNTGVINIEIGGRNSGQFDLLNISNNANFNNATINVSLINGFTPVNGDSFRIVNYGAFTGNINFNLPTLGSGLSFTPQFNSNNLTLAVGGGVSTNINYALAANPVTINEGNTGSQTVTFTISRSGATQNTSSVNYSIAGTATLNSDYNNIGGTGGATTASGTVSFAANETSKTITLSVLGDRIDENNETISVNLSNGTAPGGTASYTGNPTSVTITDDDLAPTVSINNISIAEGNTGTNTANFTVNLTNPSSQTVSVVYSTAAGITNSATANDDYTPITNATVTFNPGETTKTIGVSVVGDRIFETDETFILRLNSATNATIPAQNQGIATITNDDSLPAIAINDIDIIEGTNGIATANLTVSLSNSSSQTVSVAYATADGSAIAPSDYIAANDTITFNPGETSKTISLGIMGDGIFEANENFSVNLSNPTNATIADNQGLVTITNDDAVPSISINDVTITEGNAGIKTATFSVNLSSNSSEIISVNFATQNSTAVANGDYTATNGTVTFNPGETSKSISVEIIGDTETEVDETFFVNLSNASNATILDNQGLATIINDDIPPSISISDAATVVEGSTNNKAIFTVNLSAASTQTITVNYRTNNLTADAAIDYTGASGILTFNPGETSKTIEIPILNDNLNESDETFTVTLNDAQNATINQNTATATITDTLLASVTTTLPIGIENLTLTGTSNINATGNTNNNILTGNSANNSLNGGVGVDTLIGGSGDDSYTVDNVGDVVQEASNEGTDTVRASLNYTLSANLENVTLTGTAHVNATGNDLNNSLTGNGGNNSLNGGGGNDRLNGGVGTDTLIGGSGNDSYTVDNSGDVVQEAINAGTDSVSSSVTYTLAENVENLTLTGSNNINGTGNTGNNTLTGNTGNNTLTGGAGNDIITGGAGNDVFLFNALTEGIETIRDFAIANDVIHIQQSGFSNSLPLGSLSAEQFILGTSALDESDRFIYQQSTGNLLFDIDGNGGIAATRIATLSNKVGLGSSNIVIV